MATLASRPAPTASVPMASAAAMPSHTELVARAKAMIPTLRARSKACIANRDVAAETIVEMQEAGFFRVLQPKRWGGYEMHPNVFFDIQKQLAEGCMSTGWMYGVLGCHPYEMALFHDEAQAEVWGGDASMLGRDLWSGDLGAGVRPAEVGQDAEVTERKARLKASAKESAPSAHPGGHH